MFANILPQKIKECSGFENNKPNNTLILYAQLTIFHTEPYTRLAYCHFFHVGTFASVDNNRVRHLAPCALYIIANIAQSPDQVLVLALGIDHCDSLRSQNVRSRLQHAFGKRVIVFIQTSINFRILSSFWLQI